MSIPDALPEACQPKSDNFREFENLLAAWGLAARGYEGPKRIRRSNGAYLWEMTDDLVLVDRAVSAVGLDGSIGKKKKQALVWFYVDGRSLTEIGLRFKPPIELWECSYLLVRAREHCYQEYLKLI
jgi:hypothetical protein